MKKLVLVTFYALSTFGFSGEVAAVEPSPAPSEPVEQGSPQLPPPSPEATCAEWPYCIISTYSRNQ